MLREFIPPTEPDAERAQPPMVYVREQLTWEYKRIARDLENEQLLDERQLNKLGAEGWELVTSVTSGAVVTFYFRRPGK